MEENKLTSKEYWEGYYGNVSANARQIINVCSYYDRFWEMLIDQNRSNQSIIEIGGFPGRYLAYLASKFKLKPVCLDYNSDQSQIEKTFAALHVNDFEIIQADFTTYKPIETHDYVISNGFIEHFENFDEILDLHLKYMNDDGKLLVMIPNKRGYIKLYKSLVDKKNLKMHNLKCMKKQVFKNFAKRNNLDIIYLSYFGDFPHTVHQKSNFFQKILVKGHRFIFKRGANYLVNKYPSKFFSSSMIGIFKKVNN